MVPVDAIVDAPITPAEFAVLVPCVDVTPSADKPVSVVALTLTLIVLDCPVVVELSMRWEPSEPVTTVAVTPGLLLDDMMAAAIPLRLSFDDVTLRVIDLPPTEMVIVPVPSDDAWLDVNAPDEMLCACAICETTTE